MKKTEPPDFIVIRENPNIIQDREGRVAYVSLAELLNLKMRYRWENYSNDGEADDKAASRSV